MSIDLKFVELTADVLDIFFYEITKIYLVGWNRGYQTPNVYEPSPSPW